MGYSEQAVGLSRRQFAIVAGVLALIMAGGISIFYAVNAPVYASKTDIEAAIARSPRISSSARALKLLYPAAYAEVISDTLSQVPAEQLKSQVIGEFLGGLGRFLRLNKNAIVRAPDAQLAGVATARSIMISRLAVTSISACASYSQFAISPGWEVDETAKSLASDVDVALLRAAKAGAGPSAITRISTIDAATLAALTKATARRGMTAAQRTIQRNEGRIGLRESDRTRCIAAMLYFRSIADLPPAQAAAIIADDLRRSPLLGSGTPQ